MVMASDGSNVRPLDGSQQINKSVYKLMNKVIAWSPVPSLCQGTNYLVTALGNQIHLRREPNLEGDIIAVLAQGAVIRTLEGPIDRDGFYWWKIQTTEGQVGWAVDVAGWYVNE